MEVIDSLISHVKSADVYSDLRTIMLLGAKRYKTKHYTFLYHEESEKAKVSRNYYWSFIWYWLQRLHKAIQKCTARPYLLLVIDTTLPSDNLLCFNLLEQVSIGTIDNKIRDEKLQYDIEGAAAKISVLSSGKIDKYEYLVLT